jgi:nucleoside-diphosphate-sugar epimerase
MRILFVGGTGIISTACVRLAAQRGMDIYVLNRGSTRVKMPDGVKQFSGDIHEEDKIAALLADKTFDVAANFVSYTRPDVERDIRLFKGKVGQYIFISSASAYQKPPANYLVTESTPLCNPFWEYSRNKIACEERLVAEHRENGFPVVIVRPSLTYGDTLIPLTINRWQKSWSAVDRMLKGKPIIIHGDGSNLWTNTHNTDFAKAFISLLGDVRAIGHAIHITSDEVLTWNQCYQIVADAVGVKPRFVHIASETLAEFDAELKGCLLGDWSHSCVYDNSKIKSLVPDFAATTTFKQGMAKSVAHFRANPSLQVVDPEFDPWCDKVLAAAEKMRP